MYPVVLKIGNIELSSWEMAFMISVIIGMEIALKRARRFDITPNTVINLGIVIIPASLIGSRVWYITFFQRTGGMAMIGGVVFATLSVWVYTRVKKLSFAITGDVIAPVFLLGIGIQRWGCFGSGCCFGLPTDIPWGIVFPKGSASLHFPGISLWPTQILASLLGLTGFVLVLWLERYYCFPGYTLWLVFAYYACERFLVDQLRYYAPSYILETWGPWRINVHHPVLACLFLFSCMNWIRGWRGRPIAIQR